MQTRVDSILTARSYRWSTLQEDRDFPPIWQAWDSLSQGYGGVILCCEIPIQITRTTTPPETNSKFAPARLRHPKRKQSYSNHPFSGAFAVSFREGIHVEPLSSRYPVVRKTVIFASSDGFHPLGQMPSSNVQSLAAHGRVLEIWVRHCHKILQLSNYLVSQNGLSNFTIINFTMI